MEFQTLKFIRISKCSLMFFVLLSSSLFGQNLKDIKAKKSYIQPGLLSASATYEPSFMLNYGETNYYIMGFLEYKLTRHFSFRGDIHYLLPADSTNFLNKNMAIMFGFQYGIPIGNFEFHTGILPGISVSRSNYFISNTEVNPTLQVNMGVRFYVWKFFHFFANFSYFHLRLNNIPNRNGIADQFSISAGLGFNFQSNKKLRD